MASLLRFCLILSIGALVAGCEVTEDQLEKYITDRGFSVLVPPDNVSVPGSLVFRQHYDPKDVNPKRVMLGFLCDPRDLSLYMRGNP